MNKPQRLAREQENQAVAVYNGWHVPKSGSGDLKGDVETHSELIECKHTERLGYRLPLADWVRHKTHAILAGKRPVLEVEYTGPDGRNAHYVVVLDRDDYLEMRDQIEDLESELGDLRASMRQT